MAAGPIAERNQGSNNNANSRSLVQVMGCFKKLCIFFKFLNCSVEWETLLLIWNNTDHVSQTYNHQQDASDCCIYCSEIWLVISYVIVDIEVEGAGEFIIFSLSPGMCLWRIVNKLEQKYMFCSLVQDNSSQANKSTENVVSHVFICRPVCLNVIFRIICS